MLLAAETALGHCSVALWRDGEIIAFLRDEERARQAKMLLPMVERLLADAALSLAEVTGLAVGIGPGSFTGARIGLAAFQGIAAVRGIPVRGVSSLVACAHLVEGPCTAVLDASRGQAYTQSFDAARMPLDEPRLALITQAASWPEGALLVGSAAPAFEAAAPGRFRVLNDVPDARHIALAAADAMARGEESPTAPLYIRPPDAIIPTPFLSQRGAS